MTSTSQPDAADADGSLPPTTSKADTESKTVPRGELIETRQKLREANEKLAAMETRLAQSEKRTDPAVPNAPLLDNDSRAILNQLVEKGRITDLVSELGLASQDQGVKLVKLMTEMPSLTPDEALVIAAKRDPEAFKDRGQAAPGTGFGSLRPRPGAQPQPLQQESDTEARMKYTQSLAGKDKRQHRAYADNMVGAHLAKAMGWEHQKLPLPK